MSHQQHGGARRTVYRGAEPQRTPLVWLGIGLIALCLVGLYIRGPQPAILAALLLSPFAVYAYYLFDIWGRGRIRRVDLDGEELVLRAAFGKAWRVSVSDLDAWTLSDVALYSAGISYDAGQAVQIETGGGVRGTALTSRDMSTGARIELVAENAEIDLDAFRAIAPDAVAALESRAARKGKGHVRFADRNWG